jgi:lipopolysaccharide assembly protein A
MSSGERTIVIEIVRLTEGGSFMRWIYLAVIILFAVATLIFAVQNLEVATVSFLGFNARAPLALLTIVVYLLGAATGSSLLALLRRSYAGTRQSAASS